MGIENARAMLAEIRVHISEYRDILDDPKLMDLAYYIIDREK